MKQTVFGRSWKVLLSMVLTLCFTVAMATSLTFSFAEETTTEDNQDARLKAMATDVDLYNGSYQIDVELSGADDTVSVTSPTTLTVLDGKAYVTVQWNSPNYDYMVVNGEKLTPQNVEEGSNASFLMPVIAFDEPITVTVDSMECSLTFPEDSIQRYSSKLWIYLILSVLVVAAGAFGVYWFWQSDWGTKKKK